MQYRRTSVTWEVRAAARWSVIRDVLLERSKVTLKGNAVGENKNKKKRKHKNPGNREANGATNGGEAMANAGATNGTPPIKHSVTASLAERVMADEREKAKVRKLEMSDSMKSLFKKGDNNNDRAKGQGGGDFMTRGYSLPKRGL